MEIAKKQNVPIVTILLITILGLCACEKKINLGKFNPEIWKADMNGCDGNREVQAQYIDSLKAELLGVNENKLLEIFGRPNKQELGERNKKTYYYYLKPGGQCLFLKGDTHLLVVDLDALNRVSLITKRIE